MAHAAEVQFAAASPQLVMVPVDRGRGRGLAIFAFLLTLVGLFIPTGLVAMLGLLISLYALGRSGSGFAIMGVFLGVIGTVIWVVIDLFFLAMLMVGGVGALGVLTFGFAMTQPETLEITSDMVNIAIVLDEEIDGEGRETGSLPTLDELELDNVARVDPWGRAYRLILVDTDPGFDIISAGADGNFETDDDIRLTTLKETWQMSLAKFGDETESFFERLEDFDRRRDHAWAIKYGENGFIMEARESIAEQYEREARGAFERGGFEIPPPAAPPESPESPEIPETPETPESPTASSPGKAPAPPDEAEPVEPVDGTGPV